MNLINKHLDKDNLHHAYLIEGEKEEITPDLLEFLKEIGVEIKCNQDFNHIVLDSFKVEDARNLKSQSVEKAISANKKVFVISINNFLIEAQNTLLKMFEEPIENTIFFLIIPDASILLPTLLSRFYLIKTINDLKDETKQAEEFLTMSLNNRIDFVKELVKKTDEEAKSNEVGSPDVSTGAFREDVIQDSTRSKAIKFLNALEKVLHQKLFIDRALDSQIESKALSLSEIDYFYQILKAREYLSQPGSSTKSLMESVALVIPRL
ncbi:MAG: hypothetical protein Q8L27_03610 [archaeon]|nr:hypothetical protein [archaeon]